MDKKLIEIFESTEEGYHPQVWFGGWRVAYLNDTERFHIDNIRDMQRHNTSDEVFILLEGDCTLYIGDGDETVGTVYSVPMAVGKMYNVRKSVWHTHALKKGTQVVVIENADVSTENTGHTYFDPKTL